MASDITVTLGIDASQMQNGLNEVVNAARKAEGQGRNGVMSWLKTFNQGGIGGLMAKALGPEAQIIYEALAPVFDAIKAVVEKAKELRNLSLATDIPTGELRKLEVVAERSGVSLGQLAHSVSEFNKNMGKARISGSEMNNLLNKLGVSQEEISRGTYDYNKGLRDLAKAHKAGTDAATLAYYGNVMFGSSFEQLLPLIKQGTGELDKAGRWIYKTSNIANEQLADMSDRWDKFWANLKNGFAEFVGFADMYLNMTRNAAVTAATYGMALVSPKNAAAMLNEGFVGGKEARILAGKTIASGLPQEKADVFLKKLDELVNGEAGKKLTPLGLQTAQAASTLQQMGGGDIVSAYAFNPQEETAKNTARMVELQQQQLDEQRRGNEKSNPPKGSLYRSK